MVRFVYSLLFFSFLLGCTGKRTGEMILSAERVMDCCPDSALRILNTVNGEMFKEPGERAAYALLYTKAQCKSGSLLNSDSLIKLAQDYYSGKDDYRKIAESGYYMGRVNGELDSVWKAARYLVEAEQYALKINDDALLGLIYNELGKLHSRQYIVREALAHYRKACHYSHLASDTLNENYAVGNMAKCFLHLNQPDTAWKYCVDALKRAERRNDRTYQNHLQEYFANFYLCRDEMPPVRELSAGNDSVFCMDIAKGVAAGNLSVKGELKGMEQKMDSGRGDYFCSLNYGTLYDSLSPVDKNNYIFQVEDKYRNEHLMNQNYILEINNYHKTITLVILIFVIVVLILVALLIIGHHRKIVKEKSGMISEYTALIEALKEEHKESRNSLMEKLSGKDEKEQELKKALAKRLDIIKHLTDLSFKYGDSSRSNEIFCRKVKELMNVNMLTQDTLVDLLEIVNMNYYGIIDFLKAEYDLSKEELELCSFVSSGFTPQEMSVLYNVNVNNIYLRCSRLGKKMGLEMPLSSFIKDILPTLEEREA